MKYIIVGSGPSGLSLTLSLAEQGYEVVLIEKEDQLGGSWNSKWNNNLYFTESSPRVFIYNDINKQFLEKIGMTNKDLANIYGNLLETSFKFAKFTFKHFTIKDTYIFARTYMNNSYITVQEWLDNEPFSDKCKKAIKILCIVICDRPDKTNINNFFGAIMSMQNPIKQFREPNKWHKLIELKINDWKNVSILKSTEVQSIFTHNSKIAVNTDFKTIYGDRVVLACQSTGILNILNNSPRAIKNNWMDWKHMQKWGKNTYYSGFGFQLHFKEHVEFSKEWCKLCHDDWTVIVLPVSDWLKKPSRDPEIKTVWSCCIVDLDTKSTFIGKTANECDTKKEVLDECIRQIRESQNIPEPKVTTVSFGLKKKNGKWESINTGFTQSNEDYLPIKGQLNNLFAIGCFTKPEKQHVSHFGVALEATKTYLNQYHPNIHFLKKNNKFIILIILLIISIFLFKVLRK